ncbi:hypothetical protein [Haloarchaeobius litoreus]|uniref:MatE protein n=1 Tax=Haloarchaeobius litoreus TaxID=755306 RepID=A0ABD6DMS3_9EURY|nr:hypothetical protein [Haloarchaeobius litoreus]
MFDLQLDLPTVRSTAMHSELLQILVAISVPYAMYRITQMSQMLTWRDSAVTLARVMTPVVVLALQGVLGGASVIGVPSALVLNSLGVIVVE